MLENEICFKWSEYENIFELFHARASMHRRVYTHRCIPSDFVCCQGFAVQPWCSSLRLSRPIFPRSHKHLIWSQDCLVDSAPRTACCLCTCASDLLQCKLHAQDNTQAGASWAHVLLSVTASIMAHALLAAQGIQHCCNSRSCQPCNVAWL